MMIIKRRITKAYFDFAYQKYTPLIQKLAFRIGDNETQREELKSHATDELLKCMICYSDIGSFMTFLFGRLVGAFKHIRDKERKIRSRQTTSLDFIADMIEPNYNIDSHMIAQECLEYLDDNERDVIVQFFFNEKTTREISDSLGSAISTIFRIKENAINKMRQRCGTNLE